MQKNHWMLMAVLAGLLGSAPVSAAVVIYRCTDIFGAVTLQNDVPCPKGSKQQKQVIEPPPPMPAYRPAPVPRAAQPAPAVIVPATPAPMPAAERLPPPPLFQCNTYDNDSYLSEEGQPQPRCAPLQVTGVGGSSALAAGSACQMVTDQCQRVTDGAVCDAWKRRLREVEAAWKFGRAADTATNEVEYQRVAKIVRESTCGG
jgi:hypothetical protein